MSEAKTAVDQPRIEAAVTNPDADPTVAMPPQQYPNYPVPPVQRPENGTPNQNGAENERG